MRRSAFLPVFGWSAASYAKNRKDREFLNTRRWSVIPAGTFVMGAGKPRGASGMAEFERGNCIVKAIDPVFFAIRMVAHVSDELRRNFTSR